MKNTGPGNAVSYSFSHMGGIKIDVFEDVYPPDEDTFLLLDNIHVLAGMEFMEIGVGCGLVSIAAAKMGAKVHGTDVNPTAVENARHNAGKNGVEADFRCGDLFGPFTGRHDVIAFNPPYLPRMTGVGDDMLLSRPEELALVGGNEGFETASRFLEESRGRLFAEGIILLVLSSLGNVHKLLERHVDEYSFTRSAKRRYEGERLTLFEIREI